MDKQGQAAAAGASDTNNAGAGTGTADAPPAWFAAALATALNDTSSKLEQSMDKKINAIDKRLKAFSKTPEAQADATNGTAAAAEGADAAHAGEAANGATNGTAAAGDSDPKANAAVLRLQRELSAVMSKVTVLEQDKETLKKDGMAKDRAIALKDAMEGVPWFNDTTRDIVFKTQLPEMKQDDRGAYFFETTDGKPFFAKDWIEKIATENPNWLKAEGRRGSGATNGNILWQKGGTNLGDITQENVKDRGKRDAIAADIVSVLTNR